MRTLLTSVTMIALATAMPAGAQFREDAGVTAAQPTSSSSSRPSATNGGGGFLGGILGCSADGNKQGLAAVIGGAAGAFLGNRIAGRGSRTLGTLLGGALGAAAGSAVGCKLQKNDRDKAEAAAQRALDTGQNQSWSNDETGASGRYDIADNSSGSALGGLRFADGVEPAGSFAKVADSYTTRGATNLRAAPNTTAKVRATLPAGQRVWVPAQVKGQPWMLVSENNVAQGYVSSGLLARTTSAAKSNCKLVTQSVSVPGEAEQSETYQACKGSDGAWTMTKV
ncbi:MAG: SH3 domain-containing protein [Sphingobium sp.]|nr:SH3 domain-containing protein [Sphingobium sp.]